MTRNQTLMHSPAPWAYYEKPSLKGTAGRDD